MKKLFSFLRPRTQARDRESDGDGKPSMPRAAANRAPPCVHGAKGTAFAPWLRFRRWGRSEGTPTFYPAAASRGQKRGKSTNLSIKEEEKT